MKEKLPWIDNPAQIRLTGPGIVRLSICKKAKDTSSNIIEEDKEEDHDCLDDYILNNGSNSETAIDEVDEEDCEEDDEAC